MTPTATELRRLRRRGLRVLYEPPSTTGGKSGAVRVPAVWYVGVIGGRDLGSWVPARKSIRAGAFFGSCSSFEAALKLFCRAARTKRVRGTARCTTPRPDRVVKPRGPYRPKAAGLAKTA